MALYEERLAELGAQRTAGTLSAEQLEAGRAEAAHELLADTAIDAAPRHASLGRAVPLAAAPPSTGSPRLPRRPIRARGGLLHLLGPAFVASIAYVDPGNVAANLTAGSRYGYLLLWVLVAADVPLLRTLGAVPLALFLPGYAIAAACLPQRSLGQVERLLISLSLSVVSTALLGLVLYWSGLRLQTATWASTLVLTTIVASGRT